ncbi:MAG: FAD-binding oxidoreductase [Natronospirillum sp.]
MTLKSAYQQLLNDLRPLIPADRLISDALRTLAYGTDASFYRLIPQLVVRVESDAEVVLVLNACRRHGLPVTFRAAGTSLSGQAVTDSVLIQLGNGWNGHALLDDGASIRLQPGVIGARANAVLAPFGRKIGPDPASINSCMIGGIAANNASGMCCGTAQNSYHTVRDLCVIFADGTRLDTADPHSISAFRASHADLLQRLTELGEQTRASTELAERIRHKYRLKNTTGYSLNALVDFSDPIDILKHLMIGSEGTLGFISHITYHTVPDPAHKAAALVYFANIQTACEATMALKPTPVSAVELLDRAALRSVETMPGMPAELRELPDGATALLIDVRGTDPDALAANVQQVLAAIARIPVLQPTTFTSERKTYDLYWKVRKGTFPAVGAERVIGTTVIIEDVAFPIERLADGVLALQALLRQYRYDEAILFGHALEGNLHFVFTQGFDDPAEVQRYEAFMADVAQLVAVEYGGSLKAEHGTGRNMAPFVELEWGSEAYGLMKAIKHAFDPLNLLNPDVILSDNPKLHVENLKPLPPAHDLVDKCIECGFCESVCPSRRLTLTPRQRIVLWREIQRLANTGNQPERLRTLREEFAYAGLDTCAGDGLCATQCPVGINTGELVRHLRAEQQGRMPKTIGKQLALHFAGTTRAVRVGLRSAHLIQSVLGTPAMQVLTRVAKPLSGGMVAHWSPSMPRAVGSATHERITRHSTANISTPDATDSVVYLPACVTRSLGSSLSAADVRSVPDVMLDLLHKAGFNVIIPNGVDGLCCGMPFNSKGLFDAATQKRNELLDELKKASDNGRYPIVCDTSPCTQFLSEAAQGSELNILEPVAFVRTHALPRLNITRKNERIALHITCSATRMGLTDDMVALAQVCADDVVIPASITCCGFAGDKGFSTPELNTSALQDLKHEVKDCTRGFSNSRTCEIGLSEHSGLEYQSILYLVDEVTAAP